MVKLLFKIILSNIVLNTIVVYSSMIHLNILCIINICFWIGSGIFYFSKYKNIRYLPVLILFFYSFLILILQIVLLTKHIIWLRIITVSTNLSMVPLFKIIYSTVTIGDKKVYIIYGILYFMTLNLLFYSGKILNNFIQKK